MKRLIEPISAQPCLSATGHPAAGYAMRARERTVGI
jgi:hypothetical protein